MPTSDRPSSRHSGRRRSRSVFVLLLLASVAVIALDARTGPQSPVDPLRAAAGAVFGPLEVAAATVARPITALPEYVADVGDLRAANRRLTAENTRLRSQLATTDVLRQRADELDAMLEVSAGQGYELVPARVVTIGAAQAFSHTVTIDAGRKDGVVADMTVLNGAGLVGRVISATRSTATVLLIVDSSSVVGGRLGSTMELGFVRGHDDIGDDSVLEMQLVDDIATPRVGDTVVTWGSRNQAPYVAGVPIGTVTEVRRSPRELSSTALIEPAVDFSSLDLVGVVADARERPARETLSAGGAQ